MIFLKRSCLFLLLPMAANSGPALARDLSYYADVKPILESNCVNCHQAGGVAPFTLDDPATVVRFH